MKYIIIYMNSDNLYFKDRLKFSGSGFKISFHSLRLGDLMWTIFFFNLVSPFFIV